MQSNKILTIAYRAFTVFAFFMIVATLPAIASEEGGNDVPKLPEERIKSILKSEIEKNPNANSCKIVVTICFQRDLDTDSWVGSVDDVSALAEGFDDDDSENGKRDMAIRDDDDSSNDSYEDESSAGNNIIIWLLGVALIAILLMLFFPLLKKYLQQVSTSDNSTFNRSKTSMGSTIDKVQKTSHRQENRRRIYSDRITKPEKPDEKIEQNQQTGNVISVEVINATERESENEETKAVKEERHSEPVVPAKPVVTYGQIAVLSQDELVTEDDYMSDKAIGMPFEFTFSPSMEEGTYDIASSSRQSFLSDINMIRPYVQDFDVIANPEMIVTISKGKLRKRGMQWVVIEKAKIELK